MKEDITGLLNEQRPNHRQGYSDRTAWLMACLSELAYKKYNEFSPATDNAEKIIKGIVKKIKPKQEKIIIKAIESFTYDHEKEEEKLIEELDELGACLKWTGDENGTQCIIVKFDEFYALAFRGTESTSYKDIKSDVKANRIPSANGGLVHNGFQDAYDCIKSQIKEKLTELIGKENLPLYITGHSLGGALATIATKDLHDEFKIAACYTFGAPKVGTPEWIHGISSPIYRIVNAVDAVTMLPPTYLVLGIYFVTRHIPFLKAIGSWVYSTYGGYMHAGDMRYLTNITDGDFHKVQLLPNVDLIHRALQFFRAKKPFMGFLLDHKISIYRKKLYIIAYRKNVK